MMEGRDGLTDFTWILIGSLVVIAGMALVLWFILLRTSTNRRIALRDASLSERELEEYAQKSAARHRVSRKRDYFNWPLPELERNYAFILSVYKSLDEDIRRKLAVPASAEWLLDNFYIITEQVQELRRDLNKKSYLRLPVLKEGPMKGYARIYTVAADLTALRGGQVDETALSSYIKAYQEENTLFEREIGALPIVVKLALIENLRGLCESIQETRLQWQQADETFRAISGKGSGSIAKKLKDRIQDVEATPAYIEHLHYRLRRSERGLTAVARELDAILEVYGTSVERITRKEHNAQSLITVSMSNSITSLRYFAVLDWSVLMRSASSLEQILSQDPDGSYPEMDLDTRNHYRKQAEELAVQYRCSELHIAREAIRLAKNAYAELEQESPCLSRSGHVGYYLVGGGVARLAAAVDGGRGRRIRAGLCGRRPRQILYFAAIGMITAALVFIAAQYCRSATENWLPYALLAGIAVLIPASEIAAQTVNRVVCAAVKPVLLPKMELEEGIPDDLSTIVVIPALLPHAERVRELLDTMEGHYLSNRDDNLYFALLGAFQDAEQAHIEGDGDVIEAAFSGIRQLNQKYAAGKQDKFYFFHRDRQYNESNDTWISWERKRGALLEFGRLLLGFADTSFTSASAAVPGSIKYVITLDCDTILPMDMARAMVGTMAHPLNRPVVDTACGVVVEGYGILQPRVDVDMECAGKTVFSRIFTTQEGIDPYSGAISDVYQDLFGEGIFTGKGIYDLEIYQQILMDTFPENTVLSHDLLEGSYLRAGLATDLKLVDTFPTRYNVYASRQLRWIRGDWQLLPHLLRSVRTGTPGRIPNPLSALSMWKIIDNLRRSLVAPSLMLLAFLALTVLPGGAGFWVSILLSTALFPSFLTICGALIAAIPFGSKTKRYLTVFGVVKSSLAQGVLSVAFLPYQAWQSVHGVFVTLARLITGKNLLAWVTSADVEASQRNTPGSYLRMMGIALYQAAAALILMLLWKPGAAWLMAPILLLWAGSPLLAFGISREDRDKTVEIPEADRVELGHVARKTWRYFEEFAGEKTHYLAPDNYQVDPPKGIAWRTSPTNIGFGLLAVLTARDLGYIGTVEMVDLIDKTISTMEGLEKWNGHLYNWYDTRTLAPMKPEYVSTVDSGNLTGYLITLEQGLRQYLERPLAGRDFLDGFRDTLHCAGEDGAAAWRTISMEPGFRGCDSSLEMDPLLWSGTLRKLANGIWMERIKSEDWKAKMRHMLRRRSQETADFLPAAELLQHTPPSFSLYAGQNAASDIGRLLFLLRKNPAPCEMPALYEEAAVYAGKALERIYRTGLSCDEADLEWLRKSEAALRKARHLAEQMNARYEALLQRIENLWEAVTFLPLYDKKKKLFSIGYNVQEEKLTASFYDLLASEARQASYIAIARGEIPSSHWSRLGRSLTVVDRYKGLVSWTGTMFEYLMPLLIMKRYRNTLLDETYSLVIKSQKKYGRLRNMPWGMSESAFYSLDVRHDYQYKAIGVPWLGLKRGLAEDAVAAPYATFLALLVDPAGATENIYRLQKEGLEGPYGLYEAADYTPQRLVFESKRAIVKSYMAHHQGMSLVALDNYFHNGIMQERFHANPAIHTARLLLQERTPASILLAKTTQEKIEPVRQELRHVETLKHEVYHPDPMLPQTHILTNGNYSVMLTERGTGYSKSKMAAVTRWREDRTLDPYGMFFYLRNVETGAVWSAARAPLGGVPDQYAVLFEPDKAVFTRTDGLIETKMEVVVASGDNTEIRRVTLKNNGTSPCAIEITSYFEVVITPQADDAAHPAFSNLFVETAFDAERSCVTASRRPRSEDEKRNWLAHTVVTGGADEGVQFETDRMQFLGRGRTAKNPQGLRRGKPLSGTVGAVLDPAMSLRVRVSVMPGKSGSVSFVTLTGGSREHILAQVDQYRSLGSIRQAFQLALQRGRIETQFRDLSAAQIALYQEMISHILFISPSRQKHRTIILQNSLGQSSLWKHGISGDMPLVLLFLNGEDQVALLYELLKAHEYWRLMDVRADLVIVCDEEYGYANPLHGLIMDIVSSSRNLTIFHSPGDIFVLDRNNIQPGELSLLYAAARMIFEGGKGAMRDQMSAPKARVLPEYRGNVVKDAYDFSGMEKETGLLYDNGLGGFRPDGKEYIIQPDPSQNTPAPWVNVIANPQFGFVASESGSGYTWRENSHEYRLTPWANDAVSDNPGEVFYLTDMETGVSWTPTLLPIREGGAYKIRHGFGYTVYEHASHGLEQCLTQHVPVDGSVKISMIRLKNQSNSVRKLSVTYYIRPVLGVSDQAASMHIRTSRPEKVALLMENPYNEDFPGRICFLHTSGRAVTVTGDRWEFFGDGDISSPECLSRIGLSGNVGMGFDPCGALQAEIALEPGESKELVFLLGSARNLEEAENLANQFGGVEDAQKSLREVRRFWEGKLEAVQVSTPDDSMNLMLNGWLQYQVVSCRLWARTGHYQSGGAFGFRDQLQDSLSVAAHWPELARAQILLHARRQFTQGDVQHWWHNPQGKGVRTRISDDLLWLPYVTAEYIRITGDDGILLEELPFLEAEELGKNEMERYGAVKISEESDSLYHHCIRAVDKALKFGPHGLPLMGGGDWNDGMNTVGTKGQGESVWLAWFLIAVLDLLRPICLKLDDNETAGHYAGIRTALQKAAEESGWDGDWYRRAYFDDGSSLGSAACTDCKIDSIAQSWAVLSGAGDPDHAHRAMSMLEDYLVSREDGLIKLLTPPFDTGASEPGYIKGYVPGVRENGGQYTHAAVWAIMAFAKLGEGRKAAELYALINPVNHTGSLQGYSKYKVEPYVMAADVYAAWPHTGRGGWSWYTGAAGWMYRAGIESILGLRKNGNMLTLNPCIPSEWKEYQITYRFHDTVYQIQILNPAGVQKGVSQIAVDGKINNVKQIELSNDRGNHNIQVVMGE